MDEQGEVQGAPGGLATESASSSGAQPQAAAPLGHLGVPVGGTVEYLSTTHGGWVKAVVQGYNAGTGCYALDIQPIALPSKCKKK